MCLITFSYSHDCQKVAKNSIFLKKITFYEPNWTVSTSMDEVISSAWVSIFLKTLTFYEPNLTVSTSMAEVISSAWVSKGQSRGFKTFQHLHTIYHVFEKFLTDPVQPRLFYKQPRYSLINSFSQPFPPDLHNIINHKQ